MVVVRLICAIGSALDTILHNAKLEACHNGCVWLR